MESSKFLTIDYILDLAYISEDGADVLDQVDKTAAKRAIFDYYIDNADIGPLRFEFEQDGQVVHRTDSLFGTPYDCSPHIDKICDRDIDVSLYSERGLDTVGLRDNDYWNGDVTLIEYEGSYLNVGKTDYYTVNTFSTLLYSEAANYVLKSKTRAEANDGKFPLRDGVLSSPTDFYRTSWPSGGSGGGVIFANDGETWRIIVGRRSEDVKVNGGLVSIFPNGSIEHEDIVNSGVEETVRREFGEELFCDEEKGRRFYNSNVDAEQVALGWNLRDGGFIVGYALIINNREKYETLREKLNVNHEVDEIIEIDMMDINAVSEYVTFSEMSPENIPIICNALEYVDSSDKYPELPYSVESHQV